MKKLRIEVKEDSAQRLDSFLTEQMADVSRSLIKNLMDSGDILINGKKTKGGAKAKAGDVIEISLPEQQEIDAQPEDIAIEIVYQDEDIAVINKAQGMVTHPAAGNETGTLVNALLYHVKDLSGINGKIRPGIVHRLDKDTSGLLVVAKNDAAHTSLSAQIAEKSAGREYLALVFGVMEKDKGTIRTKIGRHNRDRIKMAVTRDGRDSVTHYEVVERFEGYTLVRCILETGRTHQIRVHLKHLGHPVVGDSVYTRRKAPFHLNGQLLHADRLTLTHPKTNEKMCFTAPLPQYFQDVIDELKK